MKNKNNETLQWLRLAVASVKADQRGNKATAEGYAKLARLSMGVKK